MALDRQVQVGHGSHGEAHAEPSKPVAGLSGIVAVYAAFLLVGSGCGWFVCNAISQTLANEHELQQGGTMFGEASLIAGVTGLCSAAFYFVFLALRPNGLSLRSGQRGGWALVSLTVLTFVLLIFFWDAGAPEYPVIYFALIAGNLVANLTNYVLFPLVASYYGGWLIAPIRAGTDLSGLFTSLLAEAQNPTGSEDMFPAWVLFTLYAALACLSLGAWTFIVWRGIGLRVESEVISSEDEEDVGAAKVIPSEDEEDVGEQIGSIELSSASTETEKKDAQSLVRCLCVRLQGFACPRSLVMPVMLATLTQVSQWGLVSNIVQIGASMTDPSGCEGPSGKWVLRTVLTMANVLIPFGSIASSMAPCPRSVFGVLCMVQFTAAAAVCSAAFGFPRVLWTDTGMAWVYISCVCISGILEGYLLTMAYRYIGDSEGIPQDLRRSASSLLSILGVITVNPITIILGDMIKSGMVQCVAP